LVVNGGRAVRRRRSKTGSTPWRRGTPGRGLVPIKIAHRAVDFPHRWRYAASAIKLNPDDNPDRSGTQKARRTAPLESPIGGLGHFTEQALLVLASLAAGPKHGYAIARDVRALTGIAIGPGTLYVVIARLERQGWVRRLPAEGRRQPYALTRAGAKALRAESTHLQSFAETLVRRAALA
jgi:DNA-binding MarR family transcriptional regulator